MERSDAIDLVASEILATRIQPCLVAIDGTDGAGKTCFADELAVALSGSSRQVIRASVDAFHNRRSIRYSKGRNSPEGFFRDSYDYVALKRLLLDPLVRGGSRAIRTEAFEVSMDSPILSVEVAAAEDSILVFDGIFLHRPQLRDYWSYSVFLDVPFHISIPRGAQRGTGSPDIRAASNRRYIEGQRIYFEECSPWMHANVVIDNSDLEDLVIRR